jgi:hypothetical protein
VTALTRTLRWSFTPGNTVTFFRWRFPASRKFLQESIDAIQTPHDRFGHQYHSRADPLVWRLRKYHQGGWRFTYRRDDHFCHHHECEELFQRKRLVPWGFWLADRDLVDRQGIQAQVDSL